MMVINNELNVFIDVDQTLLLWDKPTINAEGKLAVKFAEDVVYLTPHNYHVQLVKMYKQRGYVTFVWSANGVAHAKQAVEVLGLEASVDFVLCKPTKHMDDNPNPASILGPRVFEEDLTKGQDTISFEYFGDRSIVQVPYITTNETVKINSPVVITKSDTVLLDGVDYYKNKSGAF